MIHDQKWDETLSAYIDLDLSAEQAAAVAQHVHACVSCRLAIEDLRRVKSALADENGAGMVAPDGWTALREEIGAVTSRARILRWSAAAAAAVIISSTGWVLAHSELKGGAASVNVPTSSVSINAARDASLAIVDAAIDDARAALVSDPRDPFLIDYLDGLQRRRIKVLLEFSLRMSNQA